MNGEDLVEPEKAMGRDVYAANEIEGGQYRCHKEATDLNDSGRVPYLRQAAILRRDIC